MRNKKTKGTPTAADIQIGQNIRTIRLFRGLSQEKLAEIIGITFQQIQKYEKGTNRVAGSRFIDLSNALEVPVTAFFDGVANYNECLSLPHVTKRQQNILISLVQLGNAEIERSILKLLKGSLKE